MKPREIIFAVILAACVAAIVYGIAQMHQPTAWIAGGVLGGLWAWLLVAEVNE